MVKYIIFIVVFLNIKKKQSYTDIHDFQYTFFFGIDILFNVAVVL